MIDKTYWIRIASEWKKRDDGIAIPNLDTGNAAGIDPDEIPFDCISDDDISDILADLGLDEF